MVEKIVFTAGPSAGKTSLLRELSARGYYTAPEPARLVIDQTISSDEDLDALRGTTRFHHIVEQQSLRIMANLPGDVDTVLFDRALLDNVAYRRVNGEDIPDVFGGDDFPEQYDKVFFLEQLDFEEDYAREENPEWAREIHRELRSVYEEYGYDLIDVPVMPIDNRADYVEEHIIDRDAYKGTIH